MPDKCSILPVSDLVHVESCEIRYDNIILFYYFIYTVMPHTVLIDWT